MTDIRYLPTTENDKNEMLKSIGKPTIESLYEDIPSNLQLKKLLDLPNAHSEQEVISHFKAMLKSVDLNMLNFLGGGIYNGFIPSVINEVAHRSEYYTAYTPYAPEISQGMLQTLWEYQSYICELTGLEAANSSMYDWATAIAESALMCRRINKKKKVFLIPEIICQNRLSALTTYISGSDVEIKFIKYDRNTGQLDTDSLKSALSNDDVCGLYIESPNFFGIVEENVKEIGKIVNEKDALFVFGYQPLSLGILESPGKQGADIAIGEGQQLGIPPSFGGPLLGLFSCKDEKKLLRNLPGRVIGYTKTKDGKNDAYIMTLQTREQHIRREKATSNICSNQALMAINAVIYTALLGKDGLREIGENQIARSNYLMELLLKIPRIEIPYKDYGHIREFVVKLPKKASDVLTKMYKKGIFAGVNLSKAFPDLGESILISVTETHSSNDLEYFCKTLKGILEE